MIDLVPWTSTGECEGLATPTTKVKPSHSSSSEDCTEESGWINVSHTLHRGGEERGREGDREGGRGREREGEGGREGEGEGGREGET